MLPIDVLLGLIAAIPILGPILAALLAGLLGGLPL